MTNAPTKATADEANAGENIHPCKFCGATDPFVQPDKYGAVVKCAEPSCFITGPWAPTTAQAIERWNRPAPMPAITRAMIAAGMLNRSHIDGETVEEGEAEVVAIFKAMFAMQQGATLADAEEEDAFVIPGIPNECASQVRVAAQLCERNDYLTCASTLRAIADAMQPGADATAPDTSVGPCLRPVQDNKTT